MFFFFSRLSWLFWVHWKSIWIFKSACQFLWSSSSNTYRFSYEIFVDFLHQMSPYLLYVLTPISRAFKYCCFFFRNNFHQFHWGVVLWSSSHHHARSQPPKHKIILKTPTTQYQRDDPMLMRISYNQKSHSLLVEWKIVQKLLENSSALSYKVQHSTYPVTHQFYF